VGPRKAFGIMEPSSQEFTLRLFSKLLAGLGGFEQ